MITMMPTVNEFESAAEKEKVVLNTSYNTIDTYIYSWEGKFYMSRLG